MLQLIKQVLKSFKSSILLLIGLFFISFAIVFATFSSLYFSNNISSSYSTMESSSKGSQAILETKDDSLKNGTLEYDYDSLNSLQSISSSNGVYFSSLEDYAEIEKSFIYPVTNLYHSSFTKQGSVSNYIFAYYTDTSSNNPYFTGTGINSFDSIYKTRARGILTSYGNLVIPSESTKWRAYGLELGSSDLQYIVYDINPLTGQTNINSSTNRVNTLGYFSNGHLNSTISFSSGNLKYPTNLTANSPSETLDGSKNYQIKNGSTNTPFFISKSDWWTDQSYDLQGSSIDSVLSGFKTVDGTDDQPDIANILSSFYVDSSVSLSLDKEIDWNIASLTPWYDYMRILRDKNYLTNTVTNNSKDFVFSIHLNNDKLTTLQKETLEYVKAKYGIQKYIDLTSFVYTVNSLWIKDAALSYFDSNSTEYNEINKLSFNSLNELALTYGDYSGLSIVKTWLKNYGDDKLITIDKELKQYEKEYLSYQQMS